MKIKQADFKGIFFDIKQLPAEDLPEIALVGRSNVGKSSLINRMVNRKNLAKSSSTPGKTRSINYYLINGQWHLVDLPGYGYAKVSKSERQKWGRMIEKYLQERKQLRGVIQLLDIRHTPNENDLMMKSWLLHYEIPVLLIATKADKVSRGARQKHLAAICRAMAVAAEEVPLCFSAQTGEGVEELKTAMAEILEIS